MTEPRLNLVVLTSADLDRAARFYRLLGIEFVRERHGSGPEHLACRLGDVVLEIYPRAADVDDRLLRIGFDVPSMNDAIAEVRGANGEIITPPKDSAWGFRAVVADPDGHRVELIERTLSTRAP